MYIKKSLFADIKPLRQKIPIHLPDGNSILVHSSGRIKLHDSLVLDDVSYIPSFKHNLLSVSKLTKCNNVRFIFFPTYCEIQDLRTEKLVAVGKAKGQLYILDSNSFTTASTKAGSDRDTSFKSVNVSRREECEFVILGHHRLGHPSDVVMQHLPFYCNKEQKTTMECDICHLAKQTKLPFSSSITKSEDIFDLVHMDVWGPYSW